MREAESGNMSEKIIGGRYVYKKSLGKGGNGSVFLCQDLKLQKEWAIKEINVGAEQPAELNILKSISCNFFPRIVDVIYEQDRSYLVMDYVEGITLAEKLQRQKLKEKEVLQWAVEIAKALRYLHQMSPQILYMDCKPENIILTPQGEIRLVDLGSVYICQPEVRQRISGTRFFAPEEQQSFGRINRKKNMEAAMPDARSDIYAFGMTLYYLLAGKKKIYRRKGRLSVRDANQAVSEGMNAIIAKCTEKDPQKRFQSMDEVLYQLMHIGQIRKQERLKCSLGKGVALFGKFLCAALILIGAGIYASCKPCTIMLGSIMALPDPIMALAGSIVALGLFFFLCNHRRFTIYEVKKEVFCGSGKRVLLYLIIICGVLRIMTVSVFAEAGSDGGHETENSRQHAIDNQTKEAELKVTLYDWQGRKLLLQNGTVWRVSEDILVSIPLEELGEKEGKITISYENEENQVVKKYTFLCSKN